MDQAPPPVGGLQPPPVEPPPPVGFEQPSSGMPPPSLPPEPQKRRRAPLFIGIAVILVVAIVVAIAATSRGKKATTAASTSPSATAAPRPTAPSALQAKVSAFKVVLSWSPSTGDFFGYRISRNGTAINVVASTLTTFTDISVLPTSTYSYAVEAYTQDGANSEQAVLQVNTPKALLSAARLTGVFNVHLKGTSQFGLQSTVGSRSEGWRFKPVCASGACDVAWNELGHKDFGAKLKRSGTSYHGTDPSSVTASCNGVHVNGTVDVTVKVLTAALVRGMWVVTSIQGTMILRTAAALGCVNSGIDFTFTAKIVN